MSAFESDKADAESELTYTKQIFGYGENQTKIPGLGWNKSSGNISVVILSMKRKKATKRNILSDPASTYDLISSCTKKTTVRFVT